MALEPQAAPPSTYRPRGASSLQRLFRNHFPEFAADHDAHYPRRLGRSRLQRITKAVERFLQCGDNTKGSLPSCTYSRTQAMLYAIRKGIVKIE